MSLLPPNTTVFERNVSTVVTEATSLDVKIKMLSTLDQAPKDFLPILAWQNSVDRWNRNWSDKDKIAQIKASFQVHQKKGTVAALKEITKAFGYSLTVTEWWQEQPNNTPGTFQITIDTEGNEITEASYNTFIALLHDSKPLTRSLKGVELNVVAVRGDSNVACAHYSGDDLTIYPKQEQPIPFIYPIFAFFGHDDTTIYPRA